MKHKANHPEDASLRALVRESRSAPGLPPGFQTAVWRRIENAAASQTHWLDALAGWLFRPRLAIAGLAAVMLLGVASGAFTTMRAERLNAPARYAASVDPFQKQP